jgi:hypothetical protein
MSSGSAGDASIPRRIGAKKATRMHGAVANSTAFAASMRRRRPNFRCPDLPSPEPGTLPLRWTLIHQPRRARKLCRSGGGRFNHIMH